VDDDRIYEKGYDHGFRAEPMELFDDEEADGESDNELEEPRPWTCFDFWEHGFHKGRREAIQKTYDKGYIRGSLLSGRLNIMPASARAYGDTNA
jgi:hypothetical protein